MRPTRLGRLISGQCGALKLKEKRIIRGMIVDDIPQLEIEKLYRECLRWTPLSGHYF